ncbi:F-box only protein 33-like protein [Dinothrombium tinctorium]|uniref:F-box only protein 33-like protein n=1 Tax=Dinothrombium tinctorium TaxID=1965070 RepID=A0A3S3PK40_9ACAR|nr:F-box only protein 33-like protein [Dinothrombium tinctorium]RWS06282.1 F-box only protein 33-like protein [Dinothrombium tinctorium]RWS11321.1 F-box only protein 33-like protein [Dinothrombium tinctorium]
MADTHLWNNIPTVVLFKIYSNLSRNERMQASSTCKAWRESLFHPSIWPSKRIECNLINLTNGNKSESKRRRTAFKQFIGKCARFIHAIDFYFDCNCYTQLKELVDVISILSSSAMQGTALKRLSLKPIHIQLSVNHQSLSDAMFALLNAIQTFVARNPGLQHLSLGCLEELLNATPSLLSIMAQNSKSIQSLHLSTVKEDPDYYPVHDIPLCLFEPFVSLRALSIDYDYICDEFLTILAKKPLEKLIINVHGLDEEHPGVKRSSWSLLKANSKLEVSVNLLHTDDSPDDLRKMILDTDIPLSHFRAFFLGENTSITELVKSVALKHQNTLRSLVLVDCFSPSTLFPNPSFSRAAENELVMLAWRCKKLNHLTLIGYEISEVDLIAITRLRGSQLKELFIPSCCISLLHSPIIEDEGYYDDDRFYLDMAPPDLRSQVIADIAKPLNRDWIPMTFGEMPKAVFDPHFTPDTAYLPIIQREQCW